MKHISVNIITFILLLCLFFSCADNTGIAANEAEKTGKVTSQKKAAKKPSSTYQDTLTINTGAVVFYYPDSLQQKKNKRVA